MFTKRVLLVLAVSFMAIFLAACDRKKIADINADPGSFANKEVAIAGRVTQSIGVLSTGIYQIDDGTGSLWVLSESRGVPSKGALIGVKGRITPTLTFLGVNYATVMRETDRRSGS
jgi:hypothetical protein